MSTEIANLNTKSEKFASSSSKLGEKIALITVGNGGIGLATARRFGCQQENAMARVVRFHETGGPEVHKIEQLDVPPPGKGEVQISVKALGLNRAESMFRRGEYIEQP